MRTGNFVSFDVANYRMQRQALAARYSQLEQPSGQPPNQLSSNGQQPPHPTQGQPPQPPQQQQQQRRPPPQDIVSRPVPAGAPRTQAWKCAGYLVCNQNPALPPMLGPLPPLPPPPPGPQHSQQAQQQQQRVWGMQPFFFADRGRPASPQPIAAAAVADMSPRSDELRPVAPGEGDADTSHEAGLPAATEAALDTAGQVGARRDMDAASPPAAFPCFSQVSQEVLASDMPPVSSSKSAWLSLLFKRMSGSFHGEILSEADTQQLQRILPFFQQYALDGAATKKQQARSHARIELPYSRGKQPGSLELGPEDRRTIRAFLTADRFAAR